MSGDDARADRDQILEDFDFLAYEGFYEEQYQEINMASSSGTALGEVVSSCNDDELIFLGRKVKTQDLYDDKSTQAQMSLEKLIIQTHRALISDRTFIGDEEPRIAWSLTLSPELFLDLDKEKTAMSKIVDLADADSLRSWRPNHFLLKEMDSYKNTEAFDLQERLNQVEGEHLELIKMLLFHAMIIIG